jgi:hypothetical protein
MTFGIDSGVNLPWELMHAWSLGVCADTPALVTDLLTKKVSKSVRTKMSGQHGMLQIHFAMAQFHSIKLKKKKWLPTFPLGLQLAQMRAEDHRYCIQLFTIALGDCTDFFCEEMASKLKNVLHRIYAIGRMLHHYPMWRWTDARLKEYMNVVKGFGADYKVGTIEEF